MTTVNVNTTLRTILNQADLNVLADMLRRIKLGNMASVIKVVAAGLTAAASFDVTTAAFKALSTITGITLESDETLPAVGQVLTLRIVASGTAASLGSYIAGDVGASMIVPPGGASLAVGIARISDDGKTVSFPNTVTAFTMTYIPRAAVAGTTGAVLAEP